MKFGAHMSYNTVGYSLRFKHKMD